MLVGDALLIVAVQRHGEWVGSVGGVAADGERGLAALLHRRGTRSETESRAVVVEHLQLCGDIACRLARGTATAR